MSTLEKKIKEERDYFDPNEPKPGHRERFIDLLTEGMHRGVEASEFKKASNINSIWMKIAASLIILISVGYIAFNFINEQKSSAKNVLLIEYNNDFENILSYYDEKAASKMQEIEKIAPGDKEAISVKKAVMQQFEDLDISMAAIEKDYQKNPDNERLKAAIINSKRNKVKVMDQIIQQLNMANHQLF